MTTDLAPASGIAGLDLRNAGSGLDTVVDMSAAVQWMQRLAVMVPIVEAVIDSPFVPDAYWPMPAGVSRASGWPAQMKHRDETDEQYAARRRAAAGAAATAALWGEAYGWDPPRSWRGLYVVHGRVNLYAEAVNDILRRRGVGLEWVKREADECVLRIRRPEPGSEWREYRYTMADAEQAGYVPKKGPNERNDKGNAKYVTDPKTMLAARNLTIAARLEIPDVLGGASIAETADDDDQPVRISAEVVERPAGPTGDGSRALRSALQEATAPPRSAPFSEGADLRTETRDLPPLPGEYPQPHSPGSEHLRGGLDPKTWNAINERFRDLGVTGPGQQAARLYVIGRVVDRTIEKGSDLSAAEGDLVVSTLQGTTRDRIKQLLQERNRVEPGPATPPAPAPAGPPLPGEDVLDEEEDEDDEDLDEDDGDDLLGES